MIGYVVEQPVETIDAEGETITGKGMARVWVRTEARAKQIASEAPGRTWRVVHADDMPAHVRENMLRAAREEGLL